MDHDETYLLLLLSDSNLPTGSFVASSGFESYIKHGFGAGDSHKTTVFMRDSIGAYARNALPFVSDAHRIVECFRHREKEIDVRDCLQKLTDLDELYDAITLNHVTKRASKSQGVALLTLYSKGFSYPPASSPPGLYLDEETQKKIAVDTKTAMLVTKYKSLVRAETASGNLPICWGILTCALGLSLERSQYLHIFLHARSLLSASVRLNEIGPYNSQQVLLHLSRPIIEAEVSRCKDLRTGIGFDTETLENFDETLHGPANTWPLGEILAARHDQQHSRIFNS
ncbi:hypothetical protein BDP27DRAFT_1209941 [Rhodocollybia butyracea]|uniref:Urease accessory protein UreF n=1 Tax=Rhodocollybia butyracea TaxID=206335 RepID=A0A9P5Q8Z8_9AGAR|nr:hypothetical protein BDP27DRAFT_1209941 [Rhodocollybia butyracea]